MNRKYEFTGAVKDGVLYRIRAVRSFGGVEAGDIGGWIQSEDNLSHDGEAWVADEAVVSEGARISGDAVAEDHARVSGYAIVTDSARVGGHAVIEDHSCLVGDAQVFGNVRCTGEVIVGGRSELCGNAVITRTEDLMTFCPVGSTGLPVTFAKDSETGRVYAVFFGMRLSLKRFTQMADELVFRPDLRTAIRMAVLAAQAQLLGLPDEDAEG